MKYVLIIFVLVAIGVFSYTQDAYAQLACNDPHCYALERHRQNFVDGLEYDLAAPDLWIDRNTCTDIAVSTGWLISASNSEWAEAGVTKGYLQNLDGTTTCITQLSTYYAYNTLIDDRGQYRYTEIIVPNGRVDPGDNIDVKIQKNDQNQILAYINTPDKPDEFASARITLQSDNNYYADFGIEGTVSGPDEYSSIPMSKYTNTKILRNNSWSNLPSTATISIPITGEGYLAKKCPSNSFVAGTVTELDCNNVAVRNQIPSVSTQIINLNTNSPYTISLDGTDTDKDYLTYNLVELPTKGTLNYNNKGQKIPNTDGYSSQLIYTPASSTPESDTIRYSVTDGRDAHTREGLISIVGPAPAPTIPDAVDDFAYSLSGMTLHFTWSHPDNGGSAITFYRVERSSDTAIWNLHNTYSETATSFDYTRHQGYDQYFRIFTNNAHGASAVSNILHVHIADTTPPTITIQSPTSGTTVVTSDVKTSGYIYESQSSGIKNIKIKVDGADSSDPILTSVLSQDTNIKFESILTGMSNGARTITVYADNGDSYTASNSVTITIAVPTSKTLDSFSDDFESTMSKWTVTTEDDEYWSIRNSPIVQVPGSSSANKVAGTEDCDNICTMSMIDNVDLSKMISPKLSFYRFVATGADVSAKEGILAYVSENDGSTWSVLERFTADESDDDGAWHKEEYDLSSYSTSTKFKLKFEAISSSNSEDTELDDIIIYDASADTTPPTITVPANIAKEATGTLTKLTIQNATATDASTPIIINHNGTIPMNNGFPLGVTIINWTATDSSGNTATDYQTITLQDTTPPVLTLNGESLITIPYNSEYIDARATATDLVDGNLTESIVITTQVDTKIPNTYTITYDVVDSYGNQAISISRIVTVSSIPIDDINDARVDYSASTLTVTEGESLIIKLQYDAPLQNNKWQCFEVLDENGINGRNNGDIKFWNDKTLFSYDGEQWGGDRYIDNVFYGKCKYLTGDQLWIKIPTILDYDSTEGNEKYYIHLTKSNTNPQFELPIELIILESGRSNPVATVDTDSSTLTVTEGEPFIVKFQYDYTLPKTAWASFDVIDSDGNKIRSNTDIKLWNDKSLFSYDGVQWGGTRYHDKVFYGSYKYLKGDSIWVKIPTFTDDAIDGDKTYRLQVTVRDGDVIFPEVDLTIRDK
ncbi:MAG: DUF5011 domain-containing protein [Nitrosopumilus sp.]|nr:DUF5011 domain-containing protein [Nitrosopumilus sp.]NRA05865.1 DUF5011 domain-containing protein [Nitrosopumilus sp.]